MTLFRPLALIAAVAVLSGCSSTSYCAKPQPYENALSIPPIVVPEGMTLPAPSTALKVPETKAQSLTYGFYAPDPANKNKKRIYCLDQPPPIPPSSDATK
jgi:uncharacterized lipoprotein